MPLTTRWRGCDNVRAVDLEGWDRDLTLGVPEMDVEHGLQISLVNALEDAVASGRERELGDGILDRLLDYTRVHFLAEELMMRLEGFPAFEAHIEEHDDLVRQFESIRAVYAEGDRPVTLEAVHALRKWLAGHVRTYDRAFARFLAARGPAGHVPAQG
jgi:hemerythrin